MVATLALVVALAGGGSAVADPLAQSAANLAGQVKKALGLGKKANKRSKQALKAAQAARARSYPKAETYSKAEVYSRGESDARFLGAGAKAVDAGQLDGLDSTAFLPAGGKAVDAGQLDGLNSTAFARTGQAATAGFTLADNTTYDCGPFTQGPAVTVQVGASGLVAVYAEAVVAAGSTLPDREIRVHLHEPTALPACETIMRETNDLGLVKRTTPGSDAGTTARGGWLLFRVPPGERTFALRLGHTGNAFGSSGVADARHLYVRPL